MSQHRGSHGHGHANASEGWTSQVSCAGIGTAGRLIGRSGPMKR